MNGDAREAGAGGDGARTVLVAGTASHVGKSTVVAGLCRRLADRGVSVAPFKAQNMSNNARAVLRPDGDWGEVGVSQYVQARAAGVTPTTEHNPVLLKPTGGGESQLVVDGHAVADVAAGAYYEDHWESARAAAREAYERLAATHDVVVCEGAGSIAEINLHDRDLSNVETARFGAADVLVLGDIERGGVFASLYGTLELLPGDIRDQVVGTAITKFRGDESLLGPGIDRLETLTDVPVLDVLPYEDPGLPAEDSLSLPAVGERGRLGDDDGVPDERAVVVGVPRLPHVSNVADFDALAAEPGVRVAYLPLDADLAVDALVLPGSKNTVDDLLALRDAGFGERLRAFDGPVVGICAGYQMLGERLAGADREGTGGAETVEGFGLLPVETEFLADKRVEQTTREVDGYGPIRGASGTVSGYEIHTGRTRALDNAVDGAVDGVARPLGHESAAVGDVLGTYLHGLFDGETVRSAFVDRVFETAGRERPAGETRTADPYDRAAALVADLDRALFER